MKKYQNAQRPAPVGPGEAEHAAHVVDPADMIPSSLRCSDYSENGIG